jgi:hypothetical protein
MIALNAISWILGLVVLVCFILVIVKMFQNGDTTWGIISLVGLLCFCLPGFLIAFIRGWMKSREWNISTIMILWTVAWLINFGISVFTLPAQIEEFNRQMAIQQQQQRIR